MPETLRSNFVPRPVSMPVMRTSAMKSALIALILTATGACTPVLAAQQMATRPAVPTPAPAEAPLAQTATPVQSGGGMVDPNYVIGAGDSLEVNVFNEPKFSGNLPVRPDGMISVALIGDIQANGLTPMQLSQEITTRLKTLITDPRVTVTVLGINSKRIYLVGEVAHVGPLQMTPGMTPLQAIATAGGLSPYANEKKVYILRNVAGKQQKIPFNYHKAVKDGDQQGVTLLNGDTIVVP